MKTPENLSISQLREIHRRLDELQKKYRQLRLLDPQYILLDHADFLQLFKISRRTSSNWREKQLLPYYVLKGKIYFRLSDIHELLEKNKVEAKPQQDAAK